MKKISQIAYLIILLLIFVLFEIHQNSGTKVLKVISASEFAVDFNSNGIADEGEIVCISKFKTFTSDISKNQSELANSAGLSIDEALSIGYMSDTFAKEKLLGRKIKLELSQEHSPQCKYAEIYIDGRNYSEDLLKSGFAIVDNKPAKPELFNQKLAEAKKLNLVILNRKSGKFHKLNCKYGLKSSDFVVLPFSEAEIQFQKCKYCLVRPELQKKLKQKDLQTLARTAYPEVFESENIKFILSDYTNILAPDDKCEHVFCKEVVNLIKASNKSLDMAIYDWNNIPKVAEALENAKLRGVKIRVIYDKRTGDKFYPETDEFVNSLENKRSDEIENSKNLTSMLMHNKFIISDNQTLLTGSMNFSATGLSGFNANNVAIINSEPLAHYYTEEFERMFDGKFHTLKEKSSSDNTFAVGNSKLEVYFSPQDKTIENALVPLINNAQKYIYMPVFVITHKKMTEALLNAKKRGVDVKIILDATSVRANHSVHAILRNSGIPLKTENYAGKIHNKSMIIDDKYVVTGSMNFSNSGENKNDENCIVITNPELAKFYKGWFEFLWKKIPDKYLKYTVRAESKDSIGSCYDGIDNDYDGKVDFADEGCR